MRHISQMIGEDSRTPMERLRRFHLWKIADALELPYPKGASKTAMIALLEANNVDVTQPIAGIEWRAVKGRTSDGRDNEELYPVTPLHASARNGVNAEAVVAQRVAAKAKEEEAFEKKRLEALEADNAKLKQENAALRETLEARLAALENQVEPQTKKRDYWATYKKAQAMGLEVHRKMKINEIEALIEEHYDDTPDSGQ